MIEEIAKKHAIRCHNMLNHTYNGEPYSVHLNMSREIGEKYKYHIPEDDRDDVFSAIWQHDTLEDAKELCKFSDLVKITNLRVAMIVKSVTTIDGTRKERFSDEYYKGIRNTKYATFVKLCDRISNVKNGFDNKNPIINMYQKEHKHFKEMLYISGEYEDMWKELDSYFI